MTQKAPFANCDACPLKDAKFVPPDALKVDAAYAIVGESPGNQEAVAGKAFVGASGQLL